MPPTKDIDIPIIKRTQTDCQDFDFIIYGLKNNKIIVENPSSGECYYLNKLALSKYIKIHNTSTPWIDDLYGGKIRFDEEIIEQVVNVTENLDYYSIVINIGSWYQELYNRKEEVEDTIEFLENNKIRMSLPLYPSWIVCSKDRKRTNSPVHFNQFLMESENTFYKFPYGNTNPEGGMCLGTIRNSRTPKELFWRIINSVSNFDMLFRLSCVRDEPINSEDSFNFDDISNRIKEKQRVSVFQAFYYLTKADMNKVDPDKVFERVIPKWESN